VDGRISLEDVSGRGVEEVEIGDRRKDDNWKVVCDGIG
jgi:hypothetical protein